MKFGSYLSSRAPQLCLCGCAAVFWGIFAYFAGANAVLLWGGEIFFAAFALAWLGIGFLFAEKRLARLEKLKEGLRENTCSANCFPVPRTRRSGNIST